MNMGVLLVGTRRTRVPYVSELDIAEHVPTKLVIQMVAEHI